MSGESNVVAWLEAHGYDPVPSLVAEVFRTAKSANRTLHDDELEGIVLRFASAPAEA